MIRIQKFMGIMPVTAPELLPDTAAQVSDNVKFYSGDLQPYPRPRLVQANLPGFGPVKTLYGLTCRQNPEQVKWLTFATDVDIATSTASFDEDDCDEQRFYYTGDGVPKVTTFQMATQGGGPYPASAYDLGLPLPNTVLNTSVVAITTRNSVSVSRDNGNTATLVVNAAHGLRTGNVVSITNFPSDDTTLSSFNVTNTRVTVINSTTVSYFSPGDPVTTTNSTAGRLSLAGGTIPRSYAYTWMTPWGEESVPSEPTDDIYLKEGQRVDVTNLPAVKPAGNNFIRGIRLYRTVVSPGRSDFLRLKTLWFPTQVARVSRQSNVVTMTLQHPHNFIEDDRFKVSGCSDSSFNITGGIVTEVVNRRTFKFAQTGSNVAEKNETSGTLFHDVSEKADSTARYWGDGGNFAFIDDFDLASVTAPMRSQNYDAPPKTLRGLTTIQNNILAGFTGNRVYFSEPGQPHAWPERYAVTIDANIVGLASIGGVVLVLTDQGAHRISGNDPAIMTSAKIEGPFPCLSKQAIANMGYGIAYASHVGMIVYNPSSGLDVLTRGVHSWETWGLKIDPSTIMGVFHNNRYLGVHSTGGFAFEIDQQAGAFYSKLTETASSAWLDKRTNRLYFTRPGERNVREWDSEEAMLYTASWKSKVIRAPQYYNLGAARVIGNFDVPQAEVDAINEFNSNVAQQNAQVWLDNPSLGVMNDWSLNGGIINGDPYTVQRLSLPSVFNCVFQLWADGKLVFERTVQTDAIFRLPFGYKADNFEVAVSGPMIVKEIQLAETPTALKGV